MRTRSELQIEARRLEQRMHELGRSPQGSAGDVATGAREAIRLITFPESSVRLAGPADPGDSVTHRMVRYVLAAHDRTASDFRLIEEESVFDADGRVVRSYDPIELANSASALDVVSAGFKRIDEDRLYECVEPIAAKVLTDGFTLSEWEDALNRVQEATRDLALSTASQMRVKSDAVDLLEGRLELGDFIARTVARQDCFDFSQRVELTHEITESIEV